MINEDKMYVCKVCGESFNTERSLHAHLKKHNLTVAEYYTTHFPKKDLLTGDPLPFKNKKDYFNRDFLSRNRLIKWLSMQSREDAEVRKYIINKLEKRIKSKNLPHAPCHIELQLCQLPPIEYYKKIFGSYSEACKELQGSNMEPIYSQNIVSDFFESNKRYDDVEVLIDTREQQPLQFNKSRILKLDFGDYTTGGDQYSYTYVDRKSEADFKSTLSVGFERFKKEICRAVEFDSFLYIVVDSSINQIEKNNGFSAHKANLAFIWHNMRFLINEYPKNCQFIFSSSRAASEFLIPRLLIEGKNLWGCDMQFHIDKRIREKKQ
jgi:hypothetical protein